MRAAQGLEPKSGPSEQRLEPGKYHVEITGAEDKDVNTDKPYTQFELTARNGTDPSQINKVHSQRFYHYHSNENVTRMNQEMICLIAACAEAKFTDGQTVTSDAIKERSAKGDDILIDWATAEGRHIIVEVETRSGKEGTKDAGKVFKQLRQGCIYHIDDPKVESVPRDVKSIETSRAADVF